MSETNRKGLLVAVMLWIVIISVIGAGVKIWLFPKMKVKLEKQTSSDTHYAKGTITCAADSFSGYAIVRSDAMRDSLKSQGIKWVVQDDQADYQARIKALRDGDIQFAVFTVDSFIAAGAALNEYPGTIVMVIDESKGADAIVAYGSAISGLPDLNHPETKIVLTPNSPSEFLARIVMSHFSVNIPEDRWIKANGSGDVYKKFRAADASDKLAFVMWEPDVSRALEQSGVKDLLNSSKLEGYIVDVLVVGRKFLRDKPEQVSEVVEAYLRASYGYQQQPDSMVSLVTKDAKSNGQSLKTDQAKKLVSSIAWKNTMENYAHFGLLTGQEAKGLPSLEDVIANISKVLAQTGALSSNPIAGKETSLFYDKILSDLKDKNFHPGRVVAIAGMGDSNLEAIRGVEDLPALAEDQWNQLISVGQLRVKPITFGRGKALLTIQGQRDLDELIGNLKAWPSYYLKITGHASARGDMDANIALAQSRADAVAEYLYSGGVSPTRVKSMASKPSGEGTESLSVTFILGQLPY